MGEEGGIGDIFSLARETLERANRAMFNQEILNKLNLVFALARLDQAEKATEDEDIKKIIKAMKKELIDYLKTMFNID